ncbi:MAG: hypothetical protein MUF81_13530 [Verrucomicrobia bacterium]|jgi:hypothetical protein|nr:hypothetical protein [Verrucomicrobiota bacterium]
MIKFVGFMVSYRLSIGNPVPPAEARKLFWCCAVAFGRRPKYFLNLRHLVGRGRKLQRLLDSSGDFARAVETAKQALALATAAGNPMLAREVQSRLRLYQAGLPFYQQPPAVTWKNRAGGCGGRAEDHGCHRLSA